jgi:hypothetical protein
MSSSLNMGQLIAALTAALPSFSAHQAYSAVKAENLRSQKRITEFAEQNKELTAEQITEKYGPVTDDSVKLPASTNGSTAGTAKKSSKKVKTSAASGKTEKKGRSARKPRGEPRIVEAGPRGFRFGRKWNESIQAGEGVALHPNHINKLKAHAEAVGYKGSLDAEPAKLAAAIAGNKNFDLDTGFKGAEE